jgi:Flp pilus assembly pilin Flp
MTVIDGKSPRRRHAMLDRLAHFHREETAQDLIEYAIICVIISLGLFAGMGTLASSINTAFNHIGERLP